MWPLLAIFAGLVLVTRGGPRRRAIHEDRRGDRATAHGRDIKAAAKHAHADLLRARWQKHEDARTAREAGRDPDQIAQLEGLGNGTGLSLAPWQVFATEGIGVGDLVEDEYGDPYMVEEDETGFFFLLPLIPIAVKAANEAARSKRKRAREKKERKVHAAKEEMKGEKAAIKVEKKKAVVKAKAAPVKKVTPAKPAKGKTSTKPVKAAGFWGDAVTGDIMGDLPRDPYSNYAGY